MHHRLIPQPEFQHRQIHVPLFNDMHRNQIPALKKANFRGVFCKIPVMPLPPGEAGRLNYCGVAGLIFSPMGWRFTSSEISALPLAV